ncbi:hypothetical protein SLA2020_512460 [Shorea laevis]
MLTCVYGSKRELVAEGRKRKNLGVVVGSANSKLKAWAQQSILFEYGTGRIFNGLKRVQIDWILLSSESQTALTSATLVAHMEWCFLGLALIQDQCCNRPGRVEGCLV